MANVFFAGSMRGGFDSVSHDELRKIPDLIESMGHSLMSKHQVSPTFEEDESPLTEIQIHDRDYRWVLECDYMVAEISNPSLGVGGEIADAINVGKPVLCIYNEKITKSVSAYIRGMAGSKFCPKVECESYSEVNELNSIIDSFIKNHPVKRNIIKVAAAIVNDKKELLIVRKADSDIYINSGGRMEAGEKYLDTLKRELKEELNIQLGKAEYFKSYFSPQASHDPDCTLTFHLFIIDYTGEIKPSSEISRADWLNKEDYCSDKYNLSPLFMQVIPDLVDSKIVNL